MYLFLLLEEKLMDVTVKTVSIHIVAAIVAALISTAFTTGMLGFTNHVFAFVVGLLVMGWNPSIWILLVHFMDYFN